MRHHLWSVLGSVLASSTLLAACDGTSEVKIHTSTQSTSDGVLRVITGLQCPQIQGVLTRQGSASGDGRSCAYVGPRGTEVELKLISLNNGSARTILKDLEESLAKQMPLAAGHLGGEQLEDTVVPDINPDELGYKYTNVEMPGLKVESQGERSTVRLPGMKIEADGERSEVRIGGIVIRSDAKSDKNQVTLADQGGANGTGVQIDHSSTGTLVRAQGQGEAVRSSFRLMTKRLGRESWQSVGYEARGPSGGPMVVAVVKNRADNDDRVFDAAKELVTLNVGD